MNSPTPTLPSTHPTVSAAPAGKAPATAGVLAVPVHAGPTPVAGVPAELDLAFLAARGFEGRPGETLALLADDGTTILAVGVGAPDAVDADVLRRAAAGAVRAAGKGEGLTVALALLAAAPASLGAMASQAVAEGAVLATYRFDGYRSTAKPSPVAAVLVLGADAAALARGVRVAEAVTFARDLINEPAGVKTPEMVADAAASLAGGALEVEVWDGPTCEAERLGGIHGVGRGSDKTSRLVKLSYTPPGATASTPTVALVGKGITFDSGGLSIKTAGGMATMKIDMSGAAAVIGTLGACADLDVPVKVVGFACLAENMPGPDAIKPGDVLTFRNGKTAEVLNTDAEGRLVLADGLSLAAELAPDAIIDLATLTGACIVALGNDIAGVLGTSDALIDQVRAAGAKAGEDYWPLPLPAKYRKHLDSEIADMKNIGAAGQAGASAAGLFLKEFVGDIPWAHLDIAGPARVEGDDAHFAKGGTGFGVRTLLELLAAYQPVAVAVV